MMILKHVYPSNESICLNATLLRRLATEAGNYHTKYNLPPWPTKKNPTPYDYFPMSEEEKNLSVIEFNKILKAYYQKYVKLYHPDLSKNITMHNHKNYILTDNMKKERFHSIMKAYEVLKDPKKRLAYNKYQQTSWETYQPAANGFEAFRQANAHRTRFKYENDEEFWKAANWEDYYRMRYKRAPPTAEELDKNKYNILAGVVAIIIIAFVLQMMLALRKSDEIKRQLELQGSVAYENYLSSQTNYGFEDTQFQKVKRFLLHRRSSKHEENEDYLKKLEHEENQMLSAYVEKQVEKF